MTHSFPTRRSADLPMACFDNQKSMKARAASGCGALAVMAMARAVPSKGWPDCGPHASGAGALVSMYLGMEMPMSFSPLSTGAGVGPNERSEEHTSELQSLMRISYAVFCLKNKNNKLTRRQNSTR